MKGLYSIFVALFLTAYTNASPALPLFNIVKFKNEACTASTTRKGTCYTQEECTKQGGKKMGSNCAEGFGVCCEFSTMKCGGSTSQNSTYLLSGTQATKSTSCMYTICPASVNICRIKYEFTTLVLASQVVGTAEASGTTGKLAGSAIGACSDDNLKITGGSGTGSPVICGTNTGQHMILDSDGSASACHSININLGAGTSTRSWDIQVTQYDCKDMTALENTAGPKGCLQYHLGDASGSGFIDNFGIAVSTSSSTFSGATTHLQNQEYKICIRRFAKHNRICYSRVVDSAGSLTAQGSFGLSNPAAAAKNQAVDASCTSDYITIPFATSTSTARTAISGTAFRLCGRNFNFASTVSTSGVTVCSHSVPFEVGVKFDGSEVEVASGTATLKIDESLGAPSGYVGFHLEFKQTTHS